MGLVVASPTLLVTYKPPRTIFRIIAFEPFRYRRVFSEFACRSDATSWRARDVSSVLPLNPITRGLEFNVVLRRSRFSTRESLIKGLIASGRRYRQHAVEYLSRKNASQALAHGHDSSGHTITRSKTMGITSRIARSKATQHISRALFRPSDHGLEISDSQADVLSGERCDYHPASLVLRIP
jgi:hypothetical protein